jgi:hypothetical protein
MRTDKRTDMAKQIVTFRNFVKAPKKLILTEIAVVLQAENNSYLTFLGGDAYSSFRKERKIQERKEVKHFAFYLYYYSTLCVLVWVTDGRGTSPKFDEYR